MDKTSGPGPTDDRYIVPGLLRGLHILQAFTPERSEMTLSEIARSVGMTRSAAFRPVYTLSHLGYLLLDQRTGRFSLGPSVLRLGYGYHATRELVEIALPELERLRDATDWATHLGVRDGRHVLYMLRVPSRMGLASIVHVGSRLPAAGTTMGRVLLAGLPEAELIELYREESYRAAPARSPRTHHDLIAQWRTDREADAVVQVGRFESGAASVAAPVRDMSGQVLAAINATRVFGTVEIEPAIEGVAAQVLDAAAEISRLLGAGPGAKRRPQPATR